MFSNAIVFIQYQDPFFKLLRQFTHDPYDAVGLKCGKTFTVLNIYDGRKPKWWKKCSFAEFKENPFVDSLVIYPFLPTHVETLRLKLALSSAIASFSEKKKDLKKFLEDLFLRNQVFEERVGYLFICKVLENMTDMSIVKIEDSNILSFPHDLTIQKKQQVESPYKIEIKKFFVCIYQLYLSYDTIRFSKSIDLSPGIIVKQMQMYIYNIASQIQESPIFELDELMCKMNALAEIYNIPPMKCPDVEPHTIMICAKKKEDMTMMLDCLPQEEKFSYLTGNGLGIEKLTDSQLFELRRMIDSMNEFRIEFYELHNKINEKLSKRKKI